MVPGLSTAPGAGRQKGAAGPSRLEQTGNAPAPGVDVGDGGGGGPVETRTSPRLVRVKTEAVSASGAPDSSVGVPLMVVRTGVMVRGTPDASTEIHGAVAPVGAAAGEVDAAGADSEEEDAVVVACRPATTAAEAAGRRAARVPRERDACIVDASAEPEGL